MGNSFWGDDDRVGVAASDGSLELTSFEYDFMSAMNDVGTLSVKYKAQDMGILYRDKADVYQYGSGQEIIICPEPLHFLREYDDISDNKVKVQERFRDKIPTFKKIALERQPQLNVNGSSVNMWTNKTLDGINLRPGNLEDDATNFTGIKMSDDNVHGLIAGRTGSGKSVYINALILSLITEYPPWELDLYLADFKKVELSRYMNDADTSNNNMAFTPHVKACAATSEIRYVISLIRHLVDCMNARNEFFTRLGVTKIQEFRETYGLVLPRVLLVVDEFQQLFSDATSREGDEIQTMLNSITKLGRATGFHLIFASQEMSGTLRGNTLANFKIRMTLPCNPQISMDILGNDKAATLDRGYVLVNTESGDVLKNKKYRVPFIKTEKKDSDEDTAKTPFYCYLDNIKLDSQKFDLEYKSATQKFYREELQEKERGENEGYLYDLDRIREQKNRSICKNEDIFDGIVLGKTVMYSEKKNDKVSFYIERGRSKGVAIATPNTDDIAQIRRLLVENFIRSDDKICHVGLELNRLALERYQIGNHINQSTKQQYYELNQLEFFDVLRFDYLMRKKSMEYLKDRKNAKKISRIRELEEELCRNYNDETCVKEHEEREAKRKELISQQETWLHKHGELLAQKSGVDLNPIDAYFEKCNDIPLFVGTTSKDKAMCNSLEEYPRVINIFHTQNDFMEACDKSLAYLSGSIDDSVQHLDSMVGVAQSSDKGVELKTKIMRLKFLRCVLKYLVASVKQEQPEQFPWSRQFESIYERYQNKIVRYVDSLSVNQSLEEELELCNENLERVEDELEQLNSVRDVIEVCHNDLYSCVMEYITFCYQGVFDAMNVPVKLRNIPKVYVNVEDNVVRYKQQLDDEEELVDYDKILNADTFDMMMEALKSCIMNQKTSVLHYRKRIYWINGLDEVDKVPNYLSDLIKDSMNYNLLVIASLTSELKDALIKRAFDYAFVTGNVEKFYSMFDIRYTQQPLDSIVVNFGIHSKGLNLPFKMYKSTLAEINTPEIIEDLLENL